MAVRLDGRQGLASIPGLHHLQTSPSRRRRSLRTRSQPAGTNCPAGGCLGAAPPGRFVPVKGHAGPAGRPRPCLPRRMAGDRCALILLGGRVLRPELEQRAAQLGIFATALVLARLAERPRPFLPSRRLGGLSPPLRKRPWATSSSSLGPGGRPLVQGPVPRAREIPAWPRTLVRSPAESQGPGRRHPPPCSNDPDWPRPGGSGGQRVTAEFGRGPSAPVPRPYRRLTGA